MERDGHDAELKVQSKVDVEMDVDGENLKASQNISSLREVTWAEEDDEEYKQLLLFEKDIAVKVRDELKDVSKEREIWMKQKEKWSN